MKLKDLLAKITPLPWNPSGMSGPKTQVEIHNNSRYALHSANVLPELVEASQAILESVTTPEELERFRTALSKAENIKDK